MKYYHIRVNPKNGMILKHFWYALNIFGKSGSEQEYGIIGQDGSLQKS